MQYGNKSITANNQALTPEQESILAEYETHINNTGAPFGGRKSSIGIYFRYLNKNKFSYLQVTSTIAEKFQQYLVTKKKANSESYYAAVSVMSIVGRITAFYDYLKTRKLVLCNPFSGITKIRKKRSLPRNILDEEKMNTLLSHLRKFTEGETVTHCRQLYKAHVMAELMYSTGARIGEVIRLTETDIDFTRQTVRLYDMKTRKQREGILTQYASQILYNYINDTREYILCERSNRGRLFGGDKSLLIWLNKVINRESKALGLGHFSSHAFRHAVGYHFLRAGCDIRYIQEILGHVELRTTQVYTRVDKKDLKRVLDLYHPRNKEI